MSVYAVRVQEKGQVTIPLEIRRKLNLKKGDMVTFLETDQGIMIKSVELIASQALDEIGRQLKEKGISLEEIMALGSDIRAQIVAEQEEQQPNKLE